MAKTSAKPKETAEDIGTAIIPIETVKAQEVFVPGGTDKLIAIVEAEVAKFVPDVTTEEGRKAISRLDRRIASGKNGVESLKLEFTANLRQQVTDINAEGKRFFTRMEELQAQVSAPLDKWKAEEKARVEAHKDRLAQITAQGDMFGEQSVADLEGRIAKVNELHDESYDWQDFNELATAEYERVMTKLEALLPGARQREIDGEELRKLRADREKREAEAEAERLRKEGEDRANAQAEQDRKDAENRRVTGHQSAITQISTLGVNVGTLAAAVIEERIKRADTMLAEHDWQEFKDQAADTHKAVRSALDAQLPIARQREKDAADLAAKQAADKIKADEAKAAAAREQDKAHKAKVNNAALDAMVEHSKVGREDCQAVLVAIAKGLIPNVKISY